MAGLTYLEMVEFSAKMKLCGNPLYKKRTKEVLELVGLTDKSNNMIPELFTNQGEVCREGGEKKTTTTNKYKNN